MFNLFHFCMLDQKKPLNCFMLGIKSDFILNFCILLDDFCGLLALYEPRIILKTHIR